MAFTWDTTVFVNLILCIIILVLGFWYYAKKKSKISLYIAIAFTLFGITHLMTLYGLASSWTTFMIFLRVLAYLSVIVGLVTGQKHR